MHIAEGEAATQVSEPAAEGERALDQVATAEHAHDTDLESGNQQPTPPGSREHIAVQPEDVTPHSSSDDILVPEDTVVVPAEDVHTSAVLSSEPEQPEEEDEEARRKRIAERLAKAGGINPLSGLPLHAPTSPPTSPPLPSVDRRQSLRKDSHGSVDRARSPEATLASALRRGSTDSVGSQLASSDQAVDPPRPLPPVPTSSRPDVLGRKGSVASVQSNRELPSRRASQDGEF
ncbi:hypothetical protein IEO21_04102 [Rhodonia placenta]|uniref:Uncharacterized protein n=1 Tax=Rhodonia placenta TaxID=104341 RepID=A0A8H7U2T6_9APHY|nr:hypothetical protein IEO21_04102 [Postia placenta]